LPWSAEGRLQLVPQPGFEYDPGRDKREVVRHGPTPPVRAPLVNGSRRSRPTTGRVCYEYKVPAGDAPIEPIKRVDMFTRFFHGRGTWEFEAEVIWVDGPDGRELVVSYAPLVVFFRPTEPVRDYVFVLRNIPLPGLGRYRIYLRALKPRRRSPLAIEFFEVVRKS